MQVVNNARFWLYVLEELGYYVAYNINSGRAVDQDGDYTEQKYISG